MKKGKRLFALLLAAVMVLGLAGCGAEKPQTSEEAVTTAPLSTEAPEATETPE